MLPVQHDYATLPLPLTPDEQQTLTRLEVVIDQGLPAFYAVGEALVTIRNRKLYRGDAHTFEAYCLKRFNIGRASAYRMIDAAEVKEVLSPNGDNTLPENEAQIRALKTAPPERQADIWAKAQATAPVGKVTASHITQIVQMSMPREPDPPPAPEPERQISVFDQHLLDQDYEIIKITTPEQTIKITMPKLQVVEAYQQKLIDPVHEERRDWTCATCQQHFTDDYGFFYRSGRAVCLTCIETSDPCAACKSAHDHCYDCCHACKHTCNCKQDCRLDVQSDDEESDEREIVEPGEEFQFLQFGFYMRDREKIIKAGLRLLRPGGRRNAYEIQELLPMKSGKRTPSGQIEYSFQIIEKLETKAAMQRRMKELEQDDHIIFENHL
jgi:hypothetical protein